MLRNPVNILVVEDNSDQARLITFVLENKNGKGKIFWVKDGEEALDFLYQRGKYNKNIPFPTLIILDLKLPKLSGLEVLKQIKNDSNLKSIPVVMLTNCTGNEDTQEAYLNGVNSYVIKSTNFTEFREKVKQIKLYWLQINNYLPTKNLSP